MAGAYDAGPLFAPRQFKRPKSWRMLSGGKRQWDKYKQAKPSWTTWQECDAFWKESQRRTKETGVQQSVDHIVPLRHPLVCGLHCPANLRIIPMADNLAKGNAWWPDMPGEQSALF